MDQVEWEIGIYYFFREKESTTKQIKSILIDHHETYVQNCIEYDIYYSFYIQYFAHHIDQQQRMKVQYNKKKKKFISHT